MTYEETIKYLYDSAPLFQQIGGAAYKEGLENSIVLDNHFGNPHKSFHTVHVAGTNGKGSCSHTLAAILQSAGYRVGLYTSPHLIDFRERIRVNGTPIEKEYVVQFIQKEKEFFEPLHPSFFELTTSLAFRYFKDSKVDIAIIETGLGGRLDCTNIITPLLSIITNINFDHVQFLGNTLRKIATEKAGIIKRKTPVVIGETTDETKNVFLDKATTENSPILFASENKIIINSTPTSNGYIYQCNGFGEIEGELGGDYQIKNSNTVLSALPFIKAKGYEITPNSIKDGFANVCSLTGFMGRWQKIEEHPTIICDAGHNVGGLSYTMKQLERIRKGKLHIIFGMVNDKDINSSLSLLPKDASYYFAQASVDRALNSIELQKTAVQHSLCGEAFKNVNEALKAAKLSASANDLIFVGGSCFIVADLLSIKPH